MTQQIRTSWSRNHFTGAPSHITFHFEPLFQLVAPKIGDAVILFLFYHLFAVFSFYAFLHCAHTDFANKTQHTQQKLPKGSKQSLDVRINDEGARQLLAQEGVGKKKVTND